MSTTVSSPGGPAAVETDQPVLSEPRAGRLRRFAALDGIRAFAVAAVLCYHAGISWVGGGLLGVDVFFVLSGFLITSLLCRELSRSETVRLGRFWAQRARRLVPALVVLLLGVAAYAAWLRHSLDLASVRGDAIATLAYVANWHFIVSDQGYFNLTSAPSPLLHTWSLAVEEQFYLVWPLVVLVVARVWGAGRIWVAAALGAVASAAATAALFAAGVSVDRLYYGTDTRAQALLVGAVLGAVGSHASDRFSIVPDRWADGAHRRLAWVVPGLAGAAFLVWAWHALDGQDPTLYRGGFFLVALAAAGVILTCVTVPRSPLARFLSLRPLVYVGRISYGLYLYHWPLFLAIDHAHTGLSGFWLLAVRLGASVAAAALSFRLLEEPIRTGSWFRGWRGGTTVAAAAVVTVAALVVATTAPPVEAVAPPVHGLTTLQRQALSSARAFTTHPVRFLLVGDSVALTLGMGLKIDSIHRYGVQMIDRARLGCDLDDVATIVSGVVGPATSECVGWRTFWPEQVERNRPEVVGLLLGRWEVSDHLYQGRWVHVGEVGWDRHLTAELTEAVRIFSARGAKVVLFTLPFADPSSEAANGTPFSENLPSRTTAFNRVVDGVAASHQKVVTLIDTNKLLDPHGRYQAVVDGVTVRWADGIHISGPGGEWLQPKILPTVGALGLSVRHRSR